MDEPCEICGSTRSRRSWQLKADDLEREHRWCIDWAACHRRREGRA